MEDKNDDCLLQSCEFCKLTKEDGVKLFRCSACLVVSYCNNDHQRLDWPDHKEFCKTLPIVAALPEIQKMFQNTFGCNIFKWNHLAHAISKNHIDSIRQIFHDAGPTESLKLINAAGKERNTLLMGAASLKKCSVETLQLLLENGADPNKIGVDGGHPLAATCVVGTHEKAKMLLDYGANAELILTNGTKNSCLHIAVFNHQEDIACTLLDFGVKVNAVNVHNVTVLNYACGGMKGGTIPFVKKLLAHGADCTLAGTDGMNPIMNATRFNNIDTLELLLQQETININYLLRGNLSPLMWACVHGQAKIVAMLVQSGKCDVMLKASTLQTAWSVTFSTDISNQRDQSYIARLLLATGKIDINAGDESTAEGDTALHYSALHNKFE